MAAILVACLAAFRALFTKSDRPSQRLPDGHQKGNSRASSRRAFRFRTKNSSASKDSGYVIAMNDVVKQQNSIIVHGERCSSRTWRHYSKKSSDSEELIVPLEGVHVRNDVDTYIGTP